MPMIKALECTKCRLSIRKSRNALAAFDHSSAINTSMRTLAASSTILLCGKGHLSAHAMTLANTSLLRRNWTTQYAKGNLISTGSICSWHSHFELDIKYANQAGCRVDCHLPCHRDSLCCSDRRRGCCGQREEPRGKFEQCGDSQDLFWRKALLARRDAYQGVRSRAGRPRARCALEITGHDRG